MNEVLLHNTYQLQSFFHICW